MLIVWLAVLLAVASTSACIVRPWEPTAPVIAIARTAGREKVHGSLGVGRAGDVVVLVEVFDFL